MIPTNNSLSLTIISVSSPKFPLSSAFDNLDLAFMQSPLVPAFPLRATMILMILDNNYFPDHNSLGLLIQGGTKLIFSYFP